MSSVDQSATTSVSSVIELNSSAVALHPEKVTFLPLIWGRYVEMSSASGASTAPPYGTETTFAATLLTMKVTLYVRAISS